VAAKIPLSVTNEIKGMERKQLFASSVALSIGRKGKHVP